MRSLAVFGGTFDPIHNGHIQISLAIEKHFNFDIYLFVPCKIPVLKPDSLANSQQRIDMIKLALKNYPEFSIGLIEINRHSPSYMVDTLNDLKKKYPHYALTLIIGYDTLLSLGKWHKWRELIQLANILVVNRSNYNEQALPKEIQLILDTHLIKDKSLFLNNKYGSIMLFNAGDYDISSTEVRKIIQQNKDIDNKIPAEVWNYIKENRLYK